jgi:uncharacterized protein (DUF1499 family)
MSSKTTSFCVVVLVTSLVSLFVTPTPCFAFTSTSSRPLIKDRCNGEIVNVSGNDNGNDYSFSCNKVIVHRDLRSFSSSSSSSSSVCNRKSDKQEGNFGIGIDIDIDIDIVIVIDNDNDDNDGRRQFIKTAAGGSATLLSSCFALLCCDPANAFDNRIDDKYINATPRTGIDEPNDLRHQERIKGGQRTNYIGLKPCDTSPNCWCSSAPFENNPARYIPAWNSSPNNGNSNSIKDVKQIIDTYEVGQNNIDGGGYKIIEYINENNDDGGEQYIYVQFQSYKVGYIDDFECWYNPLSKKFDIRSSSREGYSDLGVNAKRLEYIAKRLEQEYGWTFDRRKTGMLV